MVVILDAAEAGNLRYGKSSSFFYKYSGIATYELAFVITIAQFAFSETLVLTEQCVTLLCCQIGTNSTFHAKLSTIAYAYYLELVGIVFIYECDGYSHYAIIITRYQLSL